MHLSTTLTWQELFDWLLQQWPERARIAGVDEDEDELFCPDCADDALLALVIEHDRSIAEWPHWLAHELRSLTMQISFYAWKQIDERPHGDLNVSDYVLAYDSTPREKLPPAALEARDLQGFHDAVFTLWLQSKLLNLGQLPAAVRAIGRSGHGDDSRRDG